MFLESCCIDGQARRLFSDPYSPEYAEIKVSNARYWTIGDGAILKEAFAGFKGSGAGAGEERFKHWKFDRTGSLNTQNIQGLFADTTQANQGRAYMTTWSTTDGQTLQYDNIPVSGSPLYQGIINNADWVNASTWDANYKPAGSNMTYAIATDSVPA